MFSTLGLSPAACASLTRLGYETPTPIQSAAIPLVLKGGDLLARAQTGTGKTAAFGLPLIERLLAHPSPATRRTTRGLVLVPTRELAVQVHQSLSSYAASTSLRIVVIFGGVSMNGQTHALQRGADIIVATPGRLLDHMQRRTVDLSHVEVLTLDEADRMLDMGFMPALRRVVAALPRRQQTLLFSATFSDEVIRLSSEFTQGASRVDVSPTQVVAATVSHKVHSVTADRKRDVLSQILAQHGSSQALVFCRTKRGANRVGEDLDTRGVRAGVIHGNKSQNARTRALDDFKAGRVRVLVATDIAARGLDIAHLPLVVNFDLPLVAADYVHRVGRTGRAGQQGHAVSLVCADDTALLRDIQKLVAAPLERVDAPPVAMGDAPRWADSHHAHPRHAQRTSSAPGRRTPHRQRGHQPGSGRPRRAPGRSTSGSRA
ncbi:MAG: DEAD/DEAH box helicase [Vicinamibacterales bacterium]